MKKNLVILGAGGFAREVLFHLSSPLFWYNYNINFVDDVTDTKEVVLKNGTFPVIKDWNFRPKSEFIVGIGSPKAKQIMVAKALEKGLKPTETFIHSRALVQDASVGKGGIICPGVVVTTNVKIGDYVILNLNSTVGHDAILGDYCTVNPGCSVSGNTEMGDCVTLGTGTVTREKSKIARGVTTGANSTVIKDILEENVTVIGTPAKKLL